MKGRHSEFWRFLFMGGIAAVVNLASRYGLNEVMRYEYAVIIAYLLGMVASFFLSKAFVFTFAANGRSHAQFLRFTLVNIIAAAQVWGISVGLAEYVFPAISFTYYPYDIAHVVGVVSPIFTSYFGHKYFSFRVK